MTPRRPVEVETLVLSPTPLSEAERRRVASQSGDVEFADLAALVRDGVGESIRRLRSRRRREVVITGSEPELAVFEDVLALLASLVPARRRWLRYPGEDARHLRLPVALRLVRMALSTGQALLSLCANGLNARPARLPRPLVSPTHLGRFLYIRPALMFGAPVGGSVGHVAGVVNALRRRGQQVKIVTMFEQPLIDREVDQILVPPRFRAAYPNELNRHRYHRIFLREALQIARRYDPSCLYVRYSLSDLTGVVLRRALQKPLVLEYNGSEVWAQQNWGEPLLFRAIAERIEVANLRSADLVVVVSEEIRKQVLAAGVPSERILFYPNCVDPEIFDPARFDDDARKSVRLRLGIPPEAKLFTFVGTFGKWHGTDVLAAAIRQMLDTGRSWLESRKVHFLFVGDGPLAPKVRAILEPAAGAPFVTLAGYRPQGETPGILAASDFLLSPHVPNRDGTPFFGSPTKLFEYMAIGKPIVASDLDQIGQVLRGWRPDHGEQALEEPAAVLVKPGDVDDLIRGVLLVDGMEAGSVQELGRRARAYVLRSFTWDRNVDAVLARLGQLVGGPGNPEEPSRIGTACS